MAIFSIGNRKLPRTIAIFNLPRLLTCPWATYLCKTICYARKAERKAFPKCLPQRTLNYILSLQTGFPEIIIKTLRKIKQKKIRIHESGDFYSQEYLDKWFKIMKSFPEKTFVAYTKSMLDFSQKPDNFILFFSMDKSTPPSRTLRRIKEILTKENIYNLYESSESISFTCSGNKGIDYDFLEEIKQLLKDNALVKSFEITSGEYVESDGGGFYYSSDDEEENSQ